MPLRSHTPDADPYAWIYRRGLGTDRFDEFAKPYGEDTSSFQLVKLLGLSHETYLELGIAGHIAHVGEPFELCNLQIYANDAKLSSPWPFLLTTITGIVRNSDGRNHLRLHPRYLTTVLNSMGIETTWSPDSTWDGGGRNKIHSLIAREFPLAARSETGIENPSFAWLAANSDLHLTSLLLVLTTLTEKPQDYEQYY